MNTERWDVKNHGGSPTTNESKKYAIFIGRYQPYHQGHISLIMQKINNGIPKPIWVIGSGGVNTAAAANIITTTYFLLSLRKVELTMPILANKLNTTGN